MRALVLLVVVFLCAAASAQEPPPDIFDPAVIEALKGQQVIVEKADGSELRGEVVGGSNDGTTMVLLLPSGRYVTVHPDDVAALKPAKRAPPRRRTAAERMSQDDIDNARIRERNIREALGDLSYAQGLTAVGVGTWLLGGALGTAAWLGTGNVLCWAPFGVLGLIGCGTTIWGGISWVRAGSRVDALEAVTAAPVPDQHIRYAMAY